MTHTNNNYKWCTSCNNGNSAWIFLWKGGHYDWEKKQDNNASVNFSNPTTNEIMYCSYLMTTSEEPKEEEEEGGDDSENTDLISPGCFD